MDRNILEEEMEEESTVSLSARRAWIEITRRSSSLQKIMVSLSARRAWIEMLAELCTRLGLGVALRKESVDRNIGGVCSMQAIFCRSPQGERG